MNSSKHIIAGRLHAQYLSRSFHGSVPQLVHHLCAVQAQDYAGAKWALGLRLPGVTDAGVDAALSEGTILRTHVLRPTWHFVTPQDIGWMTTLSAKRINTACATYNRKAGLDTKLFNKANKVLARELKGTQLMRQQLAAALQAAGIDTDDLRLVHILMRAEIDGVITSGGREGKQFTYALLDDRLQGYKPFTPSEPLAELALKYFAGHGPATIADFAWWAGLTLGDACKATEAVQHQLYTESIGGRQFYMTESPVSAKLPKVILLPSYDEYTVAYKDRSDILEAAHAARAKNGIFNPVVLVDGVIAGTWQRKLKQGGAEVSVFMFTQPSATVSKALAKAIKQYSNFVATEQE
jgi:hypothetical protein